MVLPAIAEGFNLPDHPIIQCKHVGGTMSPSAFAVLPFTTSSNLLACSVREILRSRTPENAVSQPRHLSKDPGNARAVGHEPTSFDRLAKGVDRRQICSRQQRQRCVNRSRT